MGRGSTSFLLLCWLCIARREPGLRQVEEHRGDLVNFEPRPLGCASASEPSIVVHCSTSQSISVHRSPPQSITVHRSPQMIVAAQGRHLSCSSEREGVGVVKVAQLRVEGGQKMERLGVERRETVQELNWAASFVAGSGGASRKKAAVGPTGRPLPKAAERNMWVY